MTPVAVQAELVRAIDSLLAEINTAHSLDIERHPAHSPIIAAQDSNRIGYKLHRRRAVPDRVISLVVDPFSFEAPGQLRLETKRRITAEILRFWDDNCADRHRFVDAAAPPPPPRVPEVVSTHPTLARRSRF
jgi:hypothetical protein